MVSGKPILLVYTLLVTPHVSFAVPSTQQPATTAPSHTQQPRDLTEDQVRSVLPELSVLEARILVREATNVLESSERDDEAESQAAREALRILDPLLLRPDQADVAAWKVVGVVAAVLHDSSLARLAVGGLMCAPEEVEAEESLIDLVARLRPLTGLPTSRLVAEHDEYLSLVANVHAGSAEAMCYLGAATSRGRWTRVDEIRAVACYRLAAAAGHPDAMRELGLMHLSGRHGVPRDHEQGLHLIRMAVDAGDTYAMVMLGERYLDGNGVSQDAPEGVRLLRQAIDAGSARAMVALGSRYLAGNRVSLDTAEGLRLYEQAIAAGDTLAMMSLGESYLDGYHVAQDASQGVRLLREAIDMGDTQAMTRLADRHLSGNGVPHNPDEGLRLYRRAIDASDTTAMWKLGDHYLRGHGVPRDIREGLRLFREAINAGDTVAMISLGDHYLDGGQLSVNMTEGLRLYQQAINAGATWAILELSDRYGYGRGVPMNPQESARLRALVP